MPRQPKTRARDLLVAERRLYVYRLREAGASYVQIAQTITHDPVWIGRLPKGYTERYAHDDVITELRHYRDDLGELSDHVRQIELQRLDRLQMAVWGRAIGTRDHPADLLALDRVLAIMDRRARLVPGVAVPQTFAQTKPDGTEAYDEAMRAHDLALLAQILHVQTEVLPPPPVDTPIE